MNPGTKVSSKATFLRGRASPSLVRSLIIPRSNSLKAASMCIINRPHAPEMSRLSRRLRRYRNDCRVSRRSVNLLQGGQFDVLGSDIGMPVKMDIHLLNVFVRSAQQVVAIFRPSR